MKKKEIQADGGCGAEKRRGRGETGKREERGKKLFKNEKNRPPF